MKAFPQRVSNEYQVEHGMDLRDYFAAKAMQSMLTGNHDYFDAVAKISYQMADVMMKARKA